MIRATRVNHDGICFEDDNTIDGPYTYGFFENWHRSTNGGEYKQPHDFFWVHFEINHGRPQRVKLHVESPTQKTDPRLNDIKVRVIEAFLATEFRDLCEAKGWRYIRNPMSGVQYRQSAVCTQAFRIELQPGQVKSSCDETLAMVLTYFRVEVDKVLSGFREEIELVLADADKGNLFTS